MNRVFISYSRKNEAFAERLARDLGDAGLDVWLDLRQIQGGENWRDEIFRGLERSEFLIALLSPSAVQSKWVQREILTAREQGKRIYPIMVENAREELKVTEELVWLRDYQYIDFEGRYEEAFPQLLEALPGGRAIGSYDVFDVEQIPNPFKGLEAFQQRDAAFFFGREELVAKALANLRNDNFMAIVGASGSGKSSLVRAGVIPQIRNGALPDSSHYPVLIFTPGQHPLNALAVRLHPLLAQQNENITESSVLISLQNTERIEAVLLQALTTLPQSSKLLLVIDQFEEVFTASGETERANFLAFVEFVATHPTTRTMIILTMRADFFGQLSRYPGLAALFEQDNLLIVTEMTTANLLRVIEGPAKAVGLAYEEGLVDRILEDVKSQPGSLPLLQYALRELYNRRDGAMLTNSGYDEIGGVRRALARHAEAIFQDTTQEQQELIRRILLRLVEVGENGEATRRRIPYSEIDFNNVPDEKIAEVVALLTAPDARLLIANQTITKGEEPTVWLEVSHEALIREWDRFKSWVSASAEDLQYESELRKAAADWEASGREASYLLTGRRLTRAEVWTEAHDISVLQDELIAASMQAREEQEQAREAQVQRELLLQRQSTNRARIIAVSTVAMLIVAAFSLFSVAQTNAALEQTNRDLEQSESDLADTVDELEDTNTALEDAIEVSEASAARARSLAIAASAAQVAGDDASDLAVSLALAANESPLAPVQAERTLADIALAPGTRARFEDIGNMTAVAINPAETLLAVGLRDGTVLLLSAEDGSTVRGFKLDAILIDEVAFSPDGRFLAAVSDSSVGALAIWNVETGEAIAADNYTRTAPEVSSVAFLRNDILIAGELNGSLTIWRVMETSLSEITSLPDFTTQGADITALAVNEQSGLIAAGADSGLIVILEFDGENVWRILSTLQPFQKAITAIDIDDAGEQLLVGYGDGVPALFTLRTGILRQAFDPLDTGISGLTFIEDTNRFVAAGQDNVLRLWDTEIGRQIVSFRIESDIRALAGSVDGKTVVTGSRDNAIRIWDIKGSAELARFSDIFSNAVALSPDGTRVAAGTTGSQVNIWDMQRDPDEQLEIISLGRGSVLIASLAFSPDSQHLVVGATDGTISLWNVNTLERLTIQSAHVGSVLALTYSPDGSQILSGGSDRKLFLRDATTLDVVRVFAQSESDDRAHAGSITSLVFSADGSLVLSGSTDRTAILWSAERGRIEQLFIGHEDAVRAVDISDDGLRILTGASDATIRLWEIEGGRELRRFTGHSRGVNGLAFLDETYDFVSAATDGTLRLWDEAGIQETRRFEVQDSNGRNIAMRTLYLDEQGGLALTALADNTLRLWQLIPGRENLIEWTRDNRFVPELNCTQRLQFGITEGGAQVFVNAGDAVDLQLLSDDTGATEVAKLAPGTALQLILNDSEDDEQETDRLLVCTVDGREGFVNPMVLNQPDQMIQQQIPATE